jgi:hypothetical protein
VNAALCTVGVLLSAPALEPTPPPAGFPWRGWLPRTILAGCLAAVVSVAADWAVVRGIYGDRPVGGAAKHIRFGPNATATKEKPGAAAPHP